MKRGDIYLADLSADSVGHEQGGVRPVLILSNDTGNLHSPAVIVAAITRRTEARLPTHVLLPSRGTGLQRFSAALLEQLRTLDKQRLGKWVGCLDKETVREVDRALAVSIGLERSST